MAKRILLGDVFDAQHLKAVTGHTGKIEWDTSKPDGAPRELTDQADLPGLGWKPGYSLKEGLTDACLWYVDNIDSVRT